MSTILARPHLTAAEPGARRGASWQLALARGPQFLMLVLSLALYCMAVTRTHLPFIDNNYSKAIAEAKQRKLPIFVDVWAPW